MKIRNHSALVRALGCDSIDDATRRIYKDTQCGAWVDWGSESSVCVGSIVEGSNVEPIVSPRRLHYPFEFQVFEAAVDSLERDVEVCWQHVNECPEDCDGQCGYFDHCGACEIDLGSPPRRATPRAYRVSLAKSIVGWRIITVRDETSHKTVPRDSDRMDAIATWLGASPRPGLVIAYDCAEGRILNGLWNGEDTAHHARRRGPRLWVTTDPLTHR
jgi:hypothetical protein